MRPCNRRASRRSRTKRETKMTGPELDHIDAELGRGCSEISDEEAQNWPLASPLAWCPHGCGRAVVTVCGRCGEPLCDLIRCIRDHARGCHAFFPPTTFNQNSAPHAWTEHHAQDAGKQPGMAQQDSKG